MAGGRHGGHHGDRQQRIDGNLPITPLARQRVRGERGAARYRVGSCHDAAQTIGGEGARPWFSTAWQNNATVVPKAGPYPIGATRHGPAAGVSRSPFPTVLISRP